MNNLHDLRDKLDKYFSLEEFQALCFELGVDYENLEGNTKLLRIQSLVINLERRGRLLELTNIARKRRPHVQWGKQAVGDIPCPYRGLSFFRTEDYEFFFGREKFIQHLTKAVKKRNFIAIIGASGSGKSSVVFAGLVPHLYQAKPCIVTHFRPTAFPFISLAKSLLPHYAVELGPTDRIEETQKLAEKLRERKIRLSQVIETIIDIHPQEHIFLIVDQFEELYTLSQDPKIHAQLIDSLLDILTPELENHLTLILTLRADFLGHVARYRPFADKLQGATEILGPMTREEMKYAIEKPASKLNVFFEEKLVERILDDVGTESDNLPLLEFSLTELWYWQGDNRLLTHTAYTQIGEVQGALKRHADKVYDSLNREERVSSQRILIQLVQPGQGTEDTRRLATYADLEEHWPTVSKLADKRLIVTNTNDITKEITAEVIHEALIRSWPRLQGWMDDHRAFRIWQERVRQDLLRWQNSNQEEDALLQGLALQDANDWITKRPHNISVAEKEFIEASLVKYQQQERLQQRQEQLRYLAFVGAIFAVVIITVLIIFNMALVTSP